MRTIDCFLACTLVLTGCSGDRGEAEGALGEAEQDVSYAAIKASLKAPPKPFWTPIDDAIVSPVYDGDLDHGAFYTPLWRGANAGIEDLVYAPPDGDCRNIKGTFRAEWDKASNTVHFTLKGRGVPVSPVVYRTEGVDYWSNPFHPRVKDLVQTGYRIWNIFGTINTGLTPFYYDPDTLLLLGGEPDFPGGPPPGAIEIGFPVFPLVSSGIVYPDNDGNLFYQYTIPYDHVTQDGGHVGAAIATFLPLDLCQSNPADPTAGQLRGYVHGWLPAGTGPSWADVLQGGLILDTTIEDTTIPYPNNDPPYVFSGVSLMSNMPALRGGTPNGYHFHLDTAIANVAPNIFPIPGGNGLGCQRFNSTPHVTGPNYCLLSP